MNRGSGGGERGAPPLVLWGTLLFLLVTNGMTLFSLTTLNLHYDQLKTDCSAELQDRDLLLRTAAAEADKVDETIQACHNDTRRAAIIGSTWLTVAVEASKNLDFKAQLRALLSTIMFEAPVRSLPGAELRLYNIQGDIERTLSDLDKVNGIGAWRQNGAFSAFPPRPPSPPNQEEKQLPSSFTSTPPSDKVAEELTSNFASMAQQLDGTCQHALFLDLGSGAQLCPSALHLMRNMVARADSFWGVWSAIQFSQGISGLLMPCTHLRGLADFLLRARKEAPLPTLIQIWLSKDLSKFPASWTDSAGLPIGVPLVSRYNLVMKDSNSKAECGAAFQVEGASTGAQKQFDASACSHTDMSPCHADFEELFLGYASAKKENPPASVPAGTRTSIPPLAQKSSGSPVNTHSANTKRILHPSLAPHQFLVGAPQSLTCDKACEGEGLACLKESGQFSKINNCDSLKQVFGELCKSCELSEGDDQPALDIEKGLCLVKTDHAVFHCDSSHAKTRRLCVCE